MLSSLILVVCVCVCGEGGAGGGLEGGTNGRRQRCNCMQMPVFCLTDHKNEATRKSVQNKLTELKRCESEKLLVIAF